MFGKMRMTFSRRRSRKSSGEALQHVGCAKSASVLARQGQHGSGVGKTVFKHLKGAWSVLFNLGSHLFELGLGLLLRRGFQDLIEHLVHSVSIAGGRLVKHVSTEVCQGICVGL
jgi:hypothetical protein